MAQISITKPTVGGSTGTWGTELNTALDTIVTGVNAGDTALAAKLATTTVTASGDLIVATGNAAVTRLPIGSSQNVLTVDATGTGGLAWKLPPGSIVAKLRQTSTQSVPTGSFTSLTWQTADYDRYSSFSSGTTYYTIGITGWVQLSGGISFTSVNTGARALQWVINGSPVPASASSMNNLGGAIYEGLSARAVSVHVNSGDQIGLQAYQSSGSALSTYSTSPHGASLQIMYLGQ